MALDNDVETDQGGHSAGGMITDLSVSPLVMRAAALLDANDAHGADILLDTQLGRHPDDALALSFHALARVQMNDVAGAQSLVERASILASGDSVCLTIIGQAYWKCGDLLQGERFFRKALLLKPAMGRAVEGLVLLLKETGQFESIAPVLDTAAESEPCNALFPKLLSQHYRAMGNRERAVAAARRAVALDQEDSRSWRELGVSLADSQKEEAVAALTRAADLGDDSADIWNILGVVLGDLDRVDEARKALRRSIELAPEAAHPWTNLGNLETRDKNGERRLEEGVAAYREALVRDPDSYEVHNNIALALRDLGQSQEALVHARRALELKPDNEVVMGTLANLLRHLGELAEARGIMERALVLSPQSPQHHANLGLIFMVERNLEAAEYHLRFAAEAPDTTVDIRLNLVQFLMGQHRYDESEALLREILAEQPAHAFARRTLGLLHFNRDEIDAAEKVYRDLLETRPGDWGIGFSLAITLYKQGRVVETLDIAKELVEERPDHPGVLNLIGCCASDVLEVSYANARLREAVDLSAPGWGADFLNNLCFTSHYGDALDESVLFAMHREWDQRYGAGVMEPGVPHENDRDPERRLRIGYVSPDFRLHSVAYFILPVIANHDRARVEVTCYSINTLSDSVTAQFKEHSDHWRDAASLTPGELAALVKRDGIDILVDLAGHTGDSRLAVFALKPAPVQVTYLGYPNTTGLTAIDWRLTDVYADPEGRDEDLLSEKPYRLPRSFLLYRHVDDMPDVVPPPVLENGYVTFGSFNNLSKLSRACLRTWVEILDGVPNSRLLFKAKVMRDPETRNRVGRTLAEWGLDMDRVDLVPYASNLKDHMSTYGKVDIALDTFPYNGTTTTFEALHMGVPVVGCWGTRHSARVGASILTNLGEAETLLGADPDDMRDKAIALANDLSRLTSYRATFREVLRGCPACQAGPFIEDIEAAYRHMWRQWVARPPTHDWVPISSRQTMMEVEDAITPGI